MMRYPIFLILSILVLLAPCSYAADPTYLNVPYTYGLYFVNPYYASTPSISFDGFLCKQPVYWYGSDWDPCGVILRFNSQDRDGAALKAIGIPGKTHKPFSDQKVEVYCADDPTKPAATAIYRINVSGSGHGLGKVTMAGGGADYPYADQSPLYHGSYPPWPIPAFPVTGSQPNYVYLWYQDAALGRTLGTYRQTDYPTVLYAGSKYVYISDLGCFLTSCCNVLRFFGIDVTPPALNSYLVSNHGYSGMLVKGDVVARYAASRGVRLKFRGKGNQVPLNEGLQRDIPMICNVPGHFVASYAYCVEAAEDSDAVGPRWVKHRIIDANGTRNCQYLEDYPSCSGTRCFYPLAPPKPKTASVQTAAISSASLDEPVESTDIVGGSICVFAGPEVEVTKLSVMDTGVIPPLASADTPEVLENATTGELMNAGLLLEYSGIGSGDYDVVVEGQPGKPFTIEITMSDAESNLLYCGNISGVFDSLGKSTLTVSAADGLKLTAAKGLKLSELCDGVLVTVVSETSGVPFAVVTGKSGSNSCMVQPLNGYVPAVRLTGIDPAQLTRGKGIVSIKGTVRVLSDGQKVLQVSSGGLTTVNGTYPVRPMGVALENLVSTNGLYCRILGRVTSLTWCGFWLDEKQYVICYNHTAQVGQHVMVDGIRGDNGTFYVQSPSDIRTVR